MHSAAQIQLQHLSQQLEQLTQGHITPTQFAKAAREAGDLLATLPDRFALVLQQLLNGLEAGAAFQEESCSFDQGQLHQNLADWLKLAKQRVSA